jgi:hypothetical protein
MTMSMSMIRSCNLKIHHAFDSNDIFVSFVDFKAYAMLNKMFVDNLFVVMKSYVRILPLYLMAMGKMLI